MKKKRGSGGQKVILAKYDGNIFRSNVKKARFKKKVSAISPFLFTLVVLILVQSSSSAFI